MNNLWRALLDPWAQEPRIFARSWEDAFDAVEKHIPDDILAFLPIDWFVLVESPGLEGPEILTIEGDEFTTIWQMGESNFFRARNEPVMPRRMDMVIDVSPPSFLGEQRLQLSYGAMRGFAFGNWGGFKVSGL